MKRLLAALCVLIAFGVGRAFRLPPVYFLGLLLVACCPGGSSSNVFSMLAEGDVAVIRVARESGGLLRAGLGANAVRFEQALDDYDFSNALALLRTHKP